MNKFTIFTIIFSAVVIITVGELVVHDYLDRHGEGRQEDVKGEIVEEKVVEDEVVEEEAAEVVTEEATITAYLSTLDYTSYGFDAAAELQEKTFPDSVFYLLSFDDDSAQRLYYELFEGETYAGGLYEVICSDSTEAFTIYTDLKQSGLDAADSGELNEVNNYGDASFYFNHSVKATSVFLVVLKDERVFAFTYGDDYHEAFKGVFDAL